MAINLIKGQRVEIESGLTRLKVEMGWKVNPNAEPAYDWMHLLSCWVAMGR